LGEHGAGAPGKAIELAEFAIGRGRTAFAETWLDILDEVERLEPKANVAR